MEQKQKMKLAWMLGLFVVIALAIFVPGHQVHADGNAITSITSGLIGYAVYGILYVISAIASVVIVFITFLIGVVLQLSNNVVNTMAVQSGFKVTLAVANLGFVLGIIIIAIATILRRETYGIKKTLWKLVVAAILVNFSLIIGGVIINFANTFTSAFLSQLPGGSQDDSGLVFAKTLAGAFSPQRALINNIVDSQKGGGGQQSKWTSWIQAAGMALGPAGTVVASLLTNAPSGTDIASMITPIVDVFCAVAFLVVIIITLAVFLVMLLIRYVSLAMLLILMPFAWLLWIFPKTAHLWSKWWNEFIRWTFFAPIVVFFLWLAIATAQAMNQNGPQTGDLAFVNGSKFKPDTADLMGGGVAKTFGDFIGTFAVTILQGTVVVGLAVGGMYTANKLSIMGAASGMTAMKGAGNWAKGYAGRQGKKAVRSTYQRAGGDRATRFLQTSRIPGFSFVGRGLATATEAGGKKLVEEAGKEASGKDSERLATELQGFSSVTNRDKQLAYLKELQKRNDLGKVTTVGGQSLAEFLSTNEKAIKEGYKDPEFYKDLQENSLLTEKVRGAQTKLTEEENNLKAGTGSVAAVGAAKADLAKEITDLLKIAKKPGAAAEYMKSDSEIAYTISKGGPLPFGMTEETYKSMREAVSAGVGQAFTAGTFSNFITKMEGLDQLDGYVDRIRNAVTGLKAAGHAPIPADFFSKGVENWIKNSPGAQNAGIDFASMGL
jgi:hypothetical protein